MKNILLNTKKPAMRLTALVLVLIMALPPAVCFPTAAEAAAVVDVGEENKPYLDTAKLSLEVMAAATGSPELKVANVILFSAIFGAEDGRSEQLVNALNEISGQLTDISNKISQMTSQLSNQIKNEAVLTRLQNRINLHIQLSAQYKVVNSVLLGAMNLLGQETNQTTRENNYKRFLLETVPSYNFSGTGFHTAVTALGESILQSDASGLDLFQAYDKLVQYSYKWEHQGYANRISFQAYTIALYTNLAALSKLSLAALYEDAVERGDDVDKANYLSAHQYLIAQIGQVSAMADSHAVIKRPDNQRYYQVPGHETLFLAQAYLRMPKGSKTFANLRHNVLELEYPTGHSEYTYPSVTFFQNIYFDYGGNVSLYNIFFDADKGNFTLPASVSSSPALTAESKSWWYQTDTFRMTYSLFEGIWGQIYGTQITPDGVKHEDSIAGTYRDPREGRDDNPVTWFSESYCSFGLPVIPHGQQGGTPVPVSGMAPGYAAPYPDDIVLTVQESGEDKTFEWQLSRDGGNSWEIVPGGDSASLPVGTVDASMKGYMYRCLIITHNLSDETSSSYSRYEMLNLECPYPPAIYPDGGDIYRDHQIGIENPNDDTVNQSVYYTLDGSPVTTSSALYLEPFALNRSATVTAAVYDSVYGWSAPTRAVFTVITSLGGGSSSSPSSTAAPEYSADVKAGGNTGTAIPVKVNKGSKTAFVDAGSQKLVPDGTVLTVPAIPDVNTYTVGIPVSALSTTAGQGSLTLNTNTGNVTVTSNMLTGVSGISGSKAEISIGQGEKSALPEDVQAAIGDKPLIQLTLSIDGKQTDWSNPNASVAVSIPYTPTAVELANPESIVVWYIDGSGNIVAIPNGRYDAATGTVTFSTTHFSDYAVAYNKVSFNDVAAGAWYNKAVNFIAARQITSGTGDGSTFSPDNKLTRGEFIVLIMRAYGISPDANPTNNFSDAGNTYYTGYLSAAKRLGITAGVGNNMYSPGNQITRQEMFTLLYNALKVIGQSGRMGEQQASLATSLPQDETPAKRLLDFSDASQISDWAREAMATFVVTGTVVGNNGKLSPADTTTRAEMAQVLYNLLGK